MKAFRTSWTMATCALAALAVAQAQDAATDQELEEVLVTAQNRVEDVQDVPIAIDLISGEEIARAGITDIRDLARLAPSIQITEDTTLTYVAIRGIGTSSNNETQDTSVIVNIDGEYINRPQVMNAAIFDLERVEVLRGPQGTLQGRNATAGALNFITRKPKFESSFGGTVSYGNYDQTIANAGADLALNDRVAFRVAGVYSRLGEGYSKHPNLAGIAASGLFNGRPYQPNFQDRSGDQELKGARLSFRAQPNEQLSIELAGEYADVFSHLQTQAFIDLNQPANAPGANCSQNGYVEVAPLVPGTQCIPLNTNFLPSIDRASYAAPTTGIGFRTLNSYAVRSRLAYDFGPATLTYIGGYRDSKNNDSPTLAPAFIFLGFLGGGRTQSHELRLNGDTERLQWQGGLFYFDEVQDMERGLYSPFVGPNGGYITYFRRKGVQNTTWSAFAQGDIKITDTLTAQAGVRYTDIDRDAVFENLGFQANTGPVPLTSTGTKLNLGAKEDNVSWLAGLNYQPNDRTLYYGKVSTGFKAGGFDAVGQYGPEKNTAYEIGEKINFGDRGQHLLNTSAFYYDYRGLQNAVLLNNTLGGQIFNAGKATIYGIEADFKYQPTQNDRFTGSLNYLQAEFDNLLAAYAVVCVGCGLGSVGDLDPTTTAVEQPNLAGNTVPNSPKFVAALGYDHVFQLGSAGTLTASLYSRYKSSYYVTIFNEHDMQQDGFTQTDVNLEWRSANRRFTAQAYAQNLEDERPLVYGSFVAAGPDRIMVFAFGRPRTYGLRLGYEF
ncbi:MAG: TonB-dependent receptor [Gammaproteobacteria bacterium]|nr:TonB-dependent receptor [Gammaproteobacteria bacterium]